MRKEDSIFNSLVKFVNRYEEGEIYLTRTMQRVATGCVERNAKYQTMLKRGGFIRNVKRGQWEVLMNIPDWFSLAHLQTLIGHDYTSMDWNNVTKEYTKTLRVKMTAQEIKDKLRGITPALRKAKEKYETFQDGYNAIPRITDNPFTMLVGNSAIAGSLENFEKAITDHIERENTATVERISREESTFYKNPDAHRYSAQLQENLMMNVGYVNSALRIIDQADFLDPVLHGRVLNIFAQLKDLARTIDERIEYKQHKQSTI